MEDSVLKDCMQYIETHLTEKLSLSLIAGYAGYSEYHFSRVFHEKMQCSVMDYVRKRRLYKAAEKILEGKRIVDVAYEYGWQSHNSFTRAFRTEYGVPPSFLRAMHLVLAEGGRKMGPITLKKYSEDMSGEELFEILKHTFLKNEIKYDEAECKRMYDRCCTVYDGIKRYSGSEYATHPLQVAVLLAEIGAEETVVYAGMFCDVFRKVQDVEKTEILARDFPQNVWELVQEVNQCEDVEEVEKEEIVLIKLAERLHNMRTIEYIDESQVKKRARETFEKFLPIARRLGNNKLTTELNDLTMRYMCKDFIDNSFYHGIK